MTDTPPASPFKPHSTQSPSPQSSKPSTVPLWFVAVGTAVILCGCCGLPCLIGSGIARRDIAARKETAVFEPHLAGYFLKAASAEVGTATAVLPGKVVTIRAEPLSVDPALWFALPPELKAATPDEVAAIVLVERYTASIGHYTQGGGNAFEFGAKVKVVNASTGQIIAERTFHGSEVPREFDREQHSDVYGSTVDDRKIIEYLQGLRQPSP